MKKILHTIYTCLLWMGFVGFALSGCKDDEPLKNNGEVVEGVPITVNLKFSGAPAADVVVDTRASGNDLSALSNLTIYVFDGNGKYQQTVSTLDGFERLEIVSGPTGASDVTYEVRFSTTSGTKKLLAVGNSTSSLWSGANNVNASEMNFEELEKHLATLNIPLNQDGEFSRPATIASDGQMMITGKNEGIQFGTDGTVVNWGESEDNIAVKMKRMMAHVTFNITQPESAKGTFVPTSYKVYNVPTKACLVNMDDDNTIVTGENAVEFNHFASTTVNPAIDNEYSFDFYMPENIYDVIEGVDGYQARDIWTDKSEELLGKKWTNAPPTSTFVVISGTYSGNSTVNNSGEEDSGDYAVTGNVQYTIHLGDFSQLTGDYGDYSIARNVSYTYNVSVVGVDKIVVEALTDIEEQPGAEGQIFTYDGSTYSYELDAHYEQLFLEYNLSSIASAITQKLGSYNTSIDDAKIDKAIADNLILVIQSEAMDYSHAGSDYTVQNKRGTLRPYQIYADAVRNGDDPTEAKKKVWQGSGTELQPEGGFDYQWIEFWPQESGTALAAYPGVSEWSRASTLTDAEKQIVYGTAVALDKTARLKDVYDVIVAMGKAVKNIYKSGSVTTTTGDTPNDDGICIVKDGNNYVARFTAFVNEYYYYEHPLTHAKVTSWDVFVNKIPREMIIAMSSKISEDGNSSYSQVYSYITQRSMETFYNSRATAINGIGIETYNETPLTQNGINFTFGYAKCSTKSGLSDTDGRSNQIALIGIDDYQYNWNYYISTDKNGWFNSTNTNHKEHKLDIEAYDNKYGQRGAYAACLSRNRDLNGNGVIDKSEVRWFLPSVNEYLRIGIGSNVLSNAAQLYLGNKASLDDDIWYTGQNNTGDKNYVTADNLTDGTLYYTSSIDNHRTYWAVEKGSYGVDGESWTAGDNPKPIRCIRVLPTNIASVDVNSDATYERVNKDPSGLTTLKFKGRLVDGLYRNGVYNSLLSIHDETGGANLYSEGIFVASENVKTTDYGGQDTDATFSLSSIIGYNANGNTLYRTNPCRNYSEGGYNSGWRVPNLVELMAMNAEGLVDNTTICCTAFSRQKVRYGFRIDAGMISCPGSKGITDLIDDKFIIRCVRDVPAGYFGN